MKVDVATNDLSGEVLRSFLPSDVIPKQSKLLLLFFSKDNPLWKQFGGGRVTQKRIAEISGVSQSTISNWRKGGSADIGALGNEFHALRTIGDGAYRNARSLGQNLFDQLDDHCRPVKQAVSADKGMILNAVLAI
jgi:hypothetical protein